MRDDHDLVRGNANIEFERVNSERERAGERLDRVLRKQAARTAVPMKLNGAAQGTARSCVAESRLSRSRTPESGQHRGG